ncbi:MAG: glycosyltransferase family 2 protein, partial [Planctomycetia bacterium]
MRIHVHATCWNEERMLPFFLRHYGPIVDRIFIYDDGSTDRSTAILYKHRKVKLESINLPGDSYVESLTTLYNGCWKRSRGEAEWVVVCNVDEHFHHPAGLRNHLAACLSDGATMVPAVGWQMITERFPSSHDKLSWRCRRGVPFSNCDKTAVFAPDRIESIGFSVGRHVVDPVGEVVFPKKTELLLLHYKNLGLKYLRERSAELNARRRSADVARDYGVQYARTESRL